LNFDLDFLGPGHTFYNVGDGLIADGLVADLIHVKWK